MIQRIKVKGKVFSGIGKGRQFMEMDWVSLGIEKLMGFFPYPGTLNVKIPERDFGLLMCMAEEGKVLASPLPGFCSARLLDARIGDTPCTVIFPEEKVWIHENTLEVAAPTRLRDSMKLEDGDEVEVEITRSFEPEGVIFDVDGTLVDSANFFYEMASLLFGPHGVVPDRELLRKAMNMGLDPWSTILPDDMPHKESVIKELKNKDRLSFVKLYAERCFLLPGVVELLGFLRSKKKKTAILTYTWDMEAVESVFLKEGIDLRHHFDSVIVVNKPGERMRPLEDALEESLKSLGLKPMKAVYVGDSVINIIAGKIKGVATVGVLTGAGKAEELRDAGADIILPHISGLLSWL